MGRGDAAGCADVSDDLAAMNVLAGGDGESGEVAVAGGDAMAVIDGDEVSVAAHEFGEGDDAVGGGVDRGAVGNRNINAAMERAFSVEGIDALTEGAGEASFDRPERWRVGGASPIGERGETVGCILQAGGGSSGESGTAQGVESIKRCLVLARAARCHWWAAGANWS